jgi:hypothetical protein
LTGDPDGEPEVLRAVRRNAMVGSEHEVVPAPKPTPDEFRRLAGDDGDLSPELALVDPDVAERARLALPDITLTEVRLSLSLKIEQTAQPPARPIDRPVVHVAASAPPIEATVVPVAAPAPPPTPAYDEIRRVFHEPRFSGRRRGRSTLVALLVLGAAAGTALALPRALDGRGSEKSADRLQPSAKATHAPSASRPKAKSASKPKAHREARARRTKRVSSSAGTTKAAGTGKATVTHTRSRPKPKRKVTPVSVRRAPRVIPAFVWVPVKGASGYLVEFRSGSKLVLRAHTRTARLRVSTKQLRRGHYRWQVWALNQAGARIGKPLVDSAVRIR